MPIKFRWPQDINAIRFGATLVWGVVNGIITTIQGTSPLSLVNAVAGRIKSLVQYGKCTTVDDEIYCNNGKLVIVDDELPSGYKRLLGITFDGNFRYETGEALTGDDDVTMTLNNLSTSGKNVFGSYNGANSKNFSLYIYGSTSGSYFRFGDQLKRPKYGGTGQRTITFGKSGTSGFADDSDVTPDEFTTPANTYIGMLPNSSSAAFTGDIIGSITVSNRLEWIPCENPGGVIGYYEKYNRNFLEPVGSGSPVSLGYDTSHLTVLSIEGTPEVLTIGTQTATVENLLAVDDIKDEQNIISGTVTRRCEAVISDGTTPSGRYIGTVGEGNIIVKVRETGYEGDVATFEADSVAPLNGLTVNVEPIQDLHGYDSPWPDGGGKNLFQTTATTKTQGGVTWTINNDGSITASGTATDYTDLNAGVAIVAGLSETVTIYGDVNASGNIVFGTLKLVDANGQALETIYNGGTKTTHTVDLTQYSNAYKIVVPLKRNNNVATSGTYHIQVVKGTTVQAWSPYSNICPISGRTSATVTRTGVNLWNIGNISTIRKYQGNLSLFSGTYTFSAIVTSEATDTNARIVLWDTDMHQLGTLQIPHDGVRHSATITVSNQVGSIELWAAQSASDSNGKAFTFSDVQVELGSNASAYEPYQGNTYTITLGDTVYGGTLDVTGGKMVVDMAMVDLGTLNWALNAQGFMWSPGIRSTAKPPATSSILGNIICSDFQAVTAISIYNGVNGIGLHMNGDIRVRYDNMPTDTSAFKAAMSGVQLCYELATPFEITLTPTQIDTLLGQNNIWSDAGAVKAYVADSALIEHVTPQPMRTAEGSNAVSVTSAVDPVQLEIDYYKNE